MVTELAILVAFYLFLLVRWQYVKRPFFFTVGVLGIAPVIAARLFSIGSVNALEIVSGILTTVGVLAAFLSAVAACYCGKLPGVEAPIGSYQQPPKP